MRPVALLSFTAWYLRRFVAANVVVAGHVLRPRLALAPVVLTYELRCRTDAEVASFVALVGLTPGTLVVDRADRVITVHAMHGDEAGERAALRDLEDRMLAARRGPGRPA